MPWGFASSIYNCMTIHSLENSCFQVNNYARSWAAWHYRKKRNVHIVALRVGIQRCLADARSVSVSWRHHVYVYHFPDSKVHGAYMGPTWGRQDPGGPHVGPMNLAIRVVHSLYFSYALYLPHIDDEFSIYCGLNKVVAILQTTYLDTFISKVMLGLLFKFHFKLFQSTMSLIRLK